MQVRFKDQYAKYWGVDPYEYFTVTANSRSGLSYWLDMRNGARTAVPAYCLIKIATPEGNPAMEFKAVKAISVEMNEIEAVKIRDALKRMRVSVNFLDATSRGQLINDGTTDTLLGLETGLINALER